jgi:hypothetical protein
MQKNKNIVVYAFLAVAITMIAASLYQKGEMWVKRQAFGDVFDAQLVRVSEKEAELRVAQLDMELERIAYKRSRIGETSAKIHSIILILICGGFLVTGLYATPISLAHLRANSVIEQHIGSSVLRIHFQTVKSPDFAQFMGLVAHIEGVRAQNPEKALEMSLQLTKAITGRLAALPHPVQSSSSAAMPQLTPVPTFRQLYDAGKVAPGQPLCMGFCQGEPQNRSINEIRSMAVAGAQGSGKTLSIAYLITSLLSIEKDSQGFVIDPHHKHHEGLWSYISPLEQTGRLTRVGEFECRERMEWLQDRLDARLNDQEPSTSLIFFVIDELPAIGKIDIFQQSILPVLSRCVSESRKARILFIGAGTRWQASNFGGDASIRQTLSSLWVHKTKPSQAEFLLEDSQDRKLVKALKSPGQALLATANSSDPSIVTVPLITKSDILTVAQALQPKEGS